MSTISSIGSAVSSAVSKVTEKATESKSTSSNASTKSYTSDAVSVSTSSTESTSESLDTKLNNIEKEKEAEFKDKNKAVDRQAIGEATDEFMLSEEAQEEMIEINGTDGNDKIKASINKENGNIIINIKPNIPIIKKNNCLKK